MSLQRGPGGGGGQVGKWVSQGSCLTGGEGEHRALSSDATEEAPGAWKMHLCVEGGKGCAPALRSSVPTGTGGSRQR